MSPTANRLRLSVTLVAVLVALTGCAGQAGEQPVEHEVITVGLRFMPDTITVTVGTTVTWRNGETIGHTITSGAWGDVSESTALRGEQAADGLFDHALAPAGQPGDEFSFTFTEPGEYLYFCQPHLTMNARVVVEE
mgnify:CR=1 FL=1